MNFSYKELSRGGKRIFLAGIIEGLYSETEKVGRLIESLSPQLVALQISQEELEQLRTASQEEKFFLSLEQEVYARKLALYGEVRVPWPHYEEVLKICKANDIPIEAIDLTEKEYITNFVKLVSPLDLIRYNLKLKRLRKKRFKVATAEEFVCKWHELLTRLKGYKRLELMREEYSATKILELLEQYPKILVFLAFQTLTGLEQRLIQLLSSRQGNI
jgi:pheromone shutdown protein TraB